MTEAMSCPVCRVPLVMSERQGVEIDYCPQCRGVWLDRGELDKIIERATPGADFAGNRGAPTRDPRDRGRYDDDDDRGSLGGFLQNLFD
jgi:Zn-finger nucleic acid-binding protein